jgi:hypothetical protein
MGLFPSKDGTYSESLIIEKLLFRKLFFAKKVFFSNTTLVIHNDPERFIIVGKF